MVSLLFSTLYVGEGLLRQLRVRELTLHMVTHMYWFEKKNTTLLCPYAPIHTHKICKQQKQAIENTET
jgi:hypothetical protein